VKQVTGTFLNPLGDPAAGATVNFVLSTPENTSYGTVVRERVQVVLDVNGSFSIELYGNDEFQTAGSFYNITLVDPVYGRILYENVAIVGESPINLNGLVPIFVK
jgi:hypothetical protein